MVQYLADGVTVDTSKTILNSGFANFAYTCQEWKVILGSEFNPDELIVMFNN